MTKKPLTPPCGTAGAILLAALADRGITVYSGDLDMSYVIPLIPSTPELEVYNHPHLVVSDCNPSVEHAPADHTGWIVWRCDENGEPVGDALYLAGDGEPVDCAADSEAAAQRIADWLTEPQH